MIWQSRLLQKPVLVICSLKVIPLMVPMDEGSGGINIRREQRTLWQARLQRNPELVIWFPVVVPFIVMDMVIIDISSLMLDIARHSRTVCWQWKHFWQVVASISTSSVTSAFGPFCCQTLNKYLLRRSLISHISSPSHHKRNNSSLPVKSFLFRKYYLISVSGTSAKSAHDGI